MSKAVEKKALVEETLLPDLAPAAVPESAPETAAAESLDSVFDVPVKVSAVLGKTKMNVASLLRMGRGAVIELDRKVGEPIDLYVNDRLIARGELVMVDGSLGVTMTEIVKDDEL
jgi:flagellar motor switch protein FliN/FliY